MNSSEHDEPMDNMNKYFKVWLCFSSFTYISYVNVVFFCCCKFYFLTGWMGVLDILESLAC